jgi:hypothetical protein
VGSARRSRRRLGRLALLSRRCLRNTVATLNSIAPQAAIPALGWIATIAEVILAAGLLIGWRLRIVACSAMLISTAGRTTSDGILSN